MWTISRAKTWIPLYVLLVGLIAWRYRNWRTVLVILIGFGIAVGLSDWLCSGLIKPLVCRLRPTHEPALDPLHLVNGYMGGRYGFCSSHAANTMACGLLFSLLYRNKTATASLMTWVALNCYSRMYLETHENLQAAIHIYERSGYRLIDKPDCVVHSAMTHFYLKELQ